MPNILIVIDPEETEQSALGRIKEIPVTADVSYKVDLYLDSRPVFAREASGSGIKDLLVDKKAWLSALVRPYVDLGYKITTEVLVCNRLYEEIIRSAREFKADFVFKPLRQHGPFKRAFYTSTDWNLIRLCPTPLLLVSDVTSVRGKPVIAAVDVRDADDAHKKLNRVVIEQASLLGRVLGADVHLVYAYGPALVPSRAAIADPLAYQIIRGKYDEEFEAAVRLGAEQDIPATKVHLREGAADDVLNDFAREIGAGITVIGTVARSGASGVFVGNTAEEVLERTETDIFVVKGSDFKAPV